MEVSRLTRDETTKVVLRDQTLRHVRGQGNIHFLCSGDDEQDGQPCPVDPDTLPYVMTILLLYVMTTNKYII